MPREQQADEAFNAAELLVKLTDRQRQVLRAFVDVPNDARIAKQLKICPQTVRNHIARIQTKLKVHGRTELMKLAARIWPEEGRADLG